MTHGSPTLSDDGTHTEYSDCFIDQSRKRIYIIDDDGAKPDIDGGWAALKKFDQGVRRLVVGVRRRTAEASYLDVMLPVSRLWYKTWRPVRMLARLKCK